MDMEKMCHYTSGKKGFDLKVTKTNSRCAVTDIHELAFSKSSLESNKKSLIVALDIKNPTLDPIWQRVIEESQDHRAFSNVYHIKAKSEGKLAKELGIELKTFPTFILHEQNQPIRVLAEIAEASDLMRFLTETNK